MKNNNPANFKLRFLATLADNLIGLLIFVLCIFYALQQPNLSQAISLLVLLSMLVLLNPIVLYHSILFTHYFGGTPGKLLTGLQVTSENGKPLSFKRILFRQSIGYSFSGLVFGLGFLSVIKDQQKQAWHDKTVGSRVIVVQNLWPLALLTCIVAFSFSFYFGSKSFESATRGPLAAEAKSLWQQYQTEIKEEASKRNKNKLKPTPSINSPLNPV